MVKIKGFIKVILMVIIIFISGCAEYVQVPNGNVAKRKTEAGLEAKIYTAGAIDVWDWWDKKTVVCLEFAQIEIEISNEILCQDKMNLPFVVAGRFGIPRDDDTAVNTAFGDLSPDKALGEKISQISNKKWFNNYVRSLFLATAKETLSHYETMEIGMIQKSILWIEMGGRIKVRSPNLLELLAQTSTLI